MNFNRDEFDILRKISKEPKINQRDLAKQLGFSLGKINYCIRALKKKGLIKINNFKKNKRKLDYLYNLTPKGVSQKTRITINFMKKKMEEYDELQSELKDKNE
jgi:EPS-associated MarR family transcriptional regulator